MLTVQQAISILEKDAKAKCNKEHTKTLERIRDTLVKRDYMGAYKIWYQTESFIAFSPEVIDFILDAKDAKTARIFIRPKKDPESWEKTYPVLVPSEIDLNSPAGQQFINTQLNIAVSEYVHEFLLVKFEEIPQCKSKEEEDGEDDEEEGAPTKLSAKTEKKKYNDDEQ